MEVLTKEFYAKAHETYGCYEGTLHLLEQEVQRLQENAKDRELFLELYKAVGDAENWDGTAVIPEGVTMLSAMAVLAHMPEMIEGLVADGFSREIAVATAKDVSAETLEAALGGGNPGMDAHLVKWFLKYICRTIVRVGRLNYEKCAYFRGKIRVYKGAKGENIPLIWNISVNKDGDAVQENEPEKFFAFGEESDYFVKGHRVIDGKAEEKQTILDKTCFEPVLTEGDPVLHVHIPAFEPFTPEIVTESYKKVLPILEKAWPDFHPKAVVCKSWLMDPVLKTMLKETSNLLAFQKPYTPFPSKANITSALSCVFHMTPEDYNLLPEETSLQRAMKAHYLSGGVVRFQFAYWLIDDFKKEFYHE